MPVATALARPPGKPSSPRTRVLCVEPSTGLRRVIRHVLERHVDLEFAATAAEARDKLHGDSAISVILAELHLDDASGLDLLYAVSQSRPDTTRILLAHDRGLKRDDDAMERAGVFCVLSMPTTESVMLTAIREGIEASILARSGVCCLAEQVRSAVAAEAGHADALPASASPAADCMIVALDALEIGMVFAADVLNLDGMLLVPRWHTVTEAVRDRLRDVWAPRLQSREFRMVLDVPARDATVHTTPSRRPPVGEHPFRAQFAGVDVTMHALGTAMDSAYDAIMITDAMLDAPGPHVLYVNPAFERMTGWSAAEMLTQTPRVLQGPETDRSTLRRLREQLSRGTPFLGSTVNYRRDGTPFLMEWSISAMNDEDGTARYYIAVQRDVTAFRRHIADAEQVDGALMLQTALSVM